MNCRVLGVVMARDEWPGLALSIVHALDHVETVLVIDHASIDGTAVGLEQLRSSFGDRLHVIRLDGVPYWQDAVVNLALAEFGTEEYEWIYPFDADEFLIVGPPSTLSELLDAVPHHCVAARYEVQNFVAPHDFDPSALAQYQRITHRSLPSQVVDVPPAILADDIAHGDVNLSLIHI